MKTGVGFSSSKRNTSSLIRSKSRKDSSVKKDGTMLLGESSSGLVQLNTSVRQKKKAMCLIIRISDKLKYFISSNFPSLVALKFRNGRFFRYSDDHPSSFCTACFCFSFEGSIYLILQTSHVLVKPHSI
jgi:hypothetical protein